MCTVIIFTHPLPCPHYVAVGVRPCPDHASIVKTTINDAAVSREQLTNDRRSDSPHDSEESPCSSSSDDGEQSFASLDSFSCADSSSSSSVAGVADHRIRVKNTFVHLDEQDDEDLVVVRKLARSRSWPSVVFSNSLRQEPVKSLSSPIVEDLSSIGSADHGTGACKPCVWFWKPGGCSNGIRCKHCHLCPESEIRRRRKSKRHAKGNTKAC